MKMCYNGIEFVMRRFGGLPHFAERKNPMPDHKSKLSSTPVVALLALFSCTLWGSAFSAVKLSYQMLGIREEAWADQLAFGGTRFAVAGLMVLLTGSIARRKPLLPAAKTLPKICIISFFQTVLQYFCYYIGLAHTSGVKASVLVGTNVFLAILISALLLRLEKLTFRKLAGSVIGFLGIILINSDGFTKSSGFTFIGEGMILLCTVASGFSSAFMKKLSADENPVLLSGWQFLLGGMVLAGIGIINGGSAGSFNGKSFLLLLYLAFISAAAYSVWAILLKHNPVSKVAVYGFLNPVCGVIISSWLLNEAGLIGPVFLISLLLVCAGIIVVNTPPRSDETSARFIRR